MLVRRNFLASVWATLASFFGLKTPSAIAKPAIESEGVEALLWAITDNGSYSWSSQQETLNDFLREVSSKYPLCKEAVIIFGSTHIHYKKTENESLQAIEVASDVSSVKACSLIEPDCETCQ